MTASLNLGDYVLATKYSDGDPGDQWCVGFYDRAEKGRHFVTDADGQQFRANGFRRVKKISPSRGQFILSHAAEIELGSKSLWFWVRSSMKNKA